MTCQTCGDMLRVPFERPDGTMRYVACWDCERGQELLGLGSLFHGASLAEAGDVGRRLLAWDGRTPGWYLHGANGRGKTTLAAAICRHQSAAGRTVRFLSSPGLLRTVKATFDERTRDEAQYTLDRYAEADVVVLDDLGAEFGTDWTASQLTEWVDGFYARRAVLVVTSNLGFAELAGTLGQRLASRIIGMTEALELTGPDRRLQRASRPVQGAERDAMPPQPTAEEYAASAARGRRRLQRAIEDLAARKSGRWSAA